MRWKLAPTMKDEYGLPCKYPDVPFQRYGHTAVAFDTKPLKWNKPAVTGTIPGARDGHSACIYDNRMYIFGGFEEIIDKFSSDVHYLDLKTMHWTYVDTRMELPFYRDFHSATIMNHKMFVFGGRGVAWNPYHSQEEIYCPKIVCQDLRLQRLEIPNTTGEEPLGCGVIRHIFLMLHGESTAALLPGAFRMDIAYSTGSISLSILTVLPKARKV